MEFIKLLLSLLSYYAVYTFFSPLSKLEVKANEKVKGNGSVEKLTSEQRTEINILKMGALLSTYPATAVGEAHINQMPK